MSKHGTQNGFSGDDRLKKSDEVARTERDSDDREQSTASPFSREERRNFFRNEWKQEVLPTPPEIPGFHLCWLSTNSKGDPIHNRMRIGYTPVKASELRGFEKYTMKGGDWDGMVSCNEMLLFKLPLEIYQEMMAEFHHHMPLEQEQSIKQRIESENNQRDSNGRKLGSTEGDGFDELGKNRVPIFH